MRNFDFQNATRILFGRDVEKDIGPEMKKLGSHVMFVHYGDGLIERLGLYGTVIESLKNAGMKVSELSGIKPSPHLDKVHEGVAYCRQNGVDCLLAVGGGSVMDTAKAVAAGVPYGGDVWDYFESKAGIVEKALPMGVIVTYPATGSEGNSGCVITNEKLMLKRWIDSNLLRPCFAMLNPEHTYGLPLYLTACGVADMFTHALERYMSNDTKVDMSDRIGEAVMRSILYSAAEVMRKPEDYDARAELMYAALIANNGYISIGRQCGWESHAIGHELTSMYGLAHGATLSIIFPAWMKYVYKTNPKRFIQFAIRVFDVDMSFEDEDTIILEGIRRMEAFFRSIGLPVRMSEAGIDSPRLEEMARKATSMGNLSGIRDLKLEDIIEIYRLAL